MRTSLGGWTKLAPTWKHGHRITTHPGPFNVLGSPKESVVVKAIKELETHSEVFDLMGLPDTPI